MSGREHQGAAGPLAGLRVVEFAGIGPGPFCGMLLSDMGAEVVQIRRPEAAPARACDFEHRGRHPVAIDLKDPAGVATCLDLAAAADILIEGFRPGVMERLGLGPDIVLARNPALVYGRMTGWGQHGPYARSAGHDLNYAAISGAIASIGAPDRPVPPLNLVADFGGGAMFLCFGLLAALTHARATGEGQVIDAAMSDGAAYLMTMTYMMRAQGRWRDSRMANLLDGGVPYYDCYRCADGEWITLGSIEPKFFASLARVLDMPPALAEARDDPATWPALRGFIETAIARRTRAEWCAAMEQAEICFAPVVGLAEAASHPHNQARGTFRLVDGMPCPNPAPRFSRTPGGVRHEAGDRAQADFPRWIEQAIAGTAAGAR